jgi:hypothetical protein
MAILVSNVKFYKERLKGRGGPGAGRFLRDGYKERTILAGFMSHCFLVVRTTPHAEKFLAIFGKYSRFTRSRLSPEN